MIDLDESESFATTLGQTNPSHDYQRPREKSELPKGGLQRIPSNNFTIDIPSTHGRHRKKDSSQSSPHISRHFRAHRSSSPDELVNFTKNARIQREDEGQKNTDQRSDGGNRQRAQHYDSLLASSPPDVSLSSMAPKNRKDLGNDVSRLSTPRVERRLQTEDESPDALQNDVTTKTSLAKQIGDSNQGRLNTKDKFRSTQRAKPVVLKHAHKVHQFRLIEYLCFNVLSTKGCALFVDETEESLWLGFADPLLNTDPLWKVPTKSIDRIEHCTESEEPRITISTRGHIPLPKLGFEFESDDTRRKFIKTLTDTDSTIKLISRDSNYLHGFFQNFSQRQVESTRSLDSRYSHVKRPQITSLSTAYGEEPEREAPVKRRRMIDNLDSPSNQYEAEMLLGSHIDQDSSVGDVKDSTSGTESAKLAIAKSDSGHTSSEARQPRRMTRSRIVDKHDFEAEPNREVGKPSVFGTLQRWKRPLIYPRAGKKRETVQFDDLQRLDDDEFLNDNLVSLFIRYLEEHAAKDTMKKVHFFNSFLFEALTKESKGRRGINFDAVRRWTVKVDLFSRDFVVVPVNENLHWFVMIICNLSYFRRMRELKEEEDDEDQELEEGADYDEDDIVEVIEKTERDKPEIILRSDLKQDPSEASARSSFAEMSLDDHSLEISSNLNSAEPVKGIRRGKKQHRRSLPKYAPDKPVIITLDSLDHARSATATALRQYIVAEAKDKQNWHIDPAEIKGMTAKGIPHQDNFSDCGLYLCMYLEQFILQPYEFVRKILQRSNETRWPKQIASSDLRDRLRNMLLALHEEQHSDAEQKTDIPPLGSIMVQMSESGDHTDISDLDPAVIRAARERYTQRKTPSQAQMSDPTQEAFSAREGVKMIESMDEWKDMTNDTILIDDDSQSQPIHIDGRRETPSKSPYFAHSKEAGAFSSHGTKPGPQTPEDDPATLAQKLRRERSPHPPDGREAQVDANHSKEINVGLANSSSKDIESQEFISSPATLPPKSSPGGSMYRKGHQRFKKPSKQENRDTIDEVSSSVAPFGSSHRSHQPFASSRAESDMAEAPPDVIHMTKGRQILHDITLGKSKHKGAEDSPESEPKMLV